MRHPASHFSSATESAPISSCSSPSFANPRRYYDQDYLKRIAPQLYGGLLRQKPDLIDRHVQHIRAPEGLGYLYQLLAIWGWTSLPWLNRLRQRTLIMAGADDPVVPLLND